MSELNVDMRITTDKALEDAKKLSAQIKDTFSKLDMSKLGAGSNKLVQSISKVNLELENVIRSTEELGKLKIPTQEYRKLEAEAKVINREIESTQRLLENLKTQGLENTTTYKNKESRLGHLLDRQYGVSDQMRRMRDAGADYTSGKETQAYRDSAQTINQMTQSLNLLMQNLSQLHAEEQQATEDAERVAEGMKHVGEVHEENSRTLGSYAQSVSNRLMPVLRRLGTLVARVARGFMNLARHIMSSRRGHEGLGRSMGASIGRLLKYTLGISSLIMLFRKLRSTATEAFKVMAQEIPEVNQAISMLMTSLKQLKASLGTAFQPLLQALAPLFNTIIQKVVSLMNAVGKFFATLTGQDYVYEATVKNIDYAESVKEAEGALASFDKLNVISKEKNDLSLTKDTVTYKKVKINPEDNWYTQLAKKIKDGWAKADLSDAGKTIANKLAEMLDGIKWEDIKSKSKKFVHTLTTGINGITMPDEETGKSPLAESIGRTIGNAIDWAVENIKEFVTTLNWDQLGDFIATTIDELKKTLDSNDVWRDVGEAFGGLFQGLVDLGFKLFVDNNIFEGLGERVSEMIHTFVEKGLEEKPGTGKTYFAAFGEALSKGFIEALVELEKIIDTAGDDLVKAVNETFLGIQTTELLLTLGRVFFKSLFLGIRLVVSAGLGALGISASGDTISFIAEAIGIGVLATKVGGLIGKIIGGNGTSGGGLLGAFKKKDNALQNQTKKVALESVAVGALATFLGTNLVDSVFGANESMETLTGTLSQMPQPLKDVKDVAEEGQAACTSLKDKVASAVDAMAEKFQSFAPKLGAIDTSSLNVFERTAISVFDRVYSKFTELNSKLNPGKTYSGASVHSGAADDAAHFGEGYEAWKAGQTETANTNAVDANTDAIDRYYNLTQEGIKATQDLTNAITTVDLEEYFGDEFMRNLYQISNDKRGYSGSAITIGDSGYQTWKQLLLEEYNALEPSQKNQVVAGFKMLLDEYKEGDVVKLFNSIPDLIGDSALTKGLENLIKWLPMAFGAMMSGMGIPSMHLAQGAVLPPNKPFLAMVGDQKSGVNVEAPLSTIEQAVANVMANMGIKVILDVKSDPYRIFKATQKEARIYYNQFGRNAFEEA